MVRLRTPGWRTCTLLLHHHPCRGWWVVLCRWRRPGPHQPHTRCGGADGALEPHIPQPLLHGRLRHALSVKIFNPTLRRHFQIWSVQASPRGGSHAQGLYQGQFPSGASVGRRLCGACIQPVDHQPSAINTRCGGVDRALKPYIPQHRCRGRAPWSPKPEHLVRGARL